MIDINSLSCLNHKVIIQKIYSYTTNQNFKVDIVGLIEIIYG